MKSAILIAILLCFSGCTVISQDLRQKATPELTFEQVKDNPMQYAGEIVIWGWYIIKNEASRNKTRLVVLQAPLSYRDAPESKDLSRGRFLAVAHSYLDPEVYSRDRAVTIAGKIADSTRSLQSDRYGPYPVISIQEIHLWNEAYGVDPYYRRYPPAHHPYPHHYYPPYGRRHHFFHP